MLTVPQAAARVSKSPETIRRWIRSGRLRAQKVGTQHLIDEEDLEALSESETLPIPESWGWDRTITGEPMPDVVAAIRLSRQGH
ncbi:MAG: helix-turn-helix domain-containing protein [Egibacteraceae bacterium]